MKQAVVLKDITKKIKKYKVLNHVSTEIEENSICGILGENDAEKTAFLKIIQTAYLPDSGTLTVFGEPPFENQNILSEICYMQGNLRIFEKETVNNILSYGKNFYKNWDFEVEERLIREFKIPVKEYYSRLSKSMRSAVSIILGMASGAKIVLFDRVENGLNRIEREYFYQILSEDVRKSSRTFLISTQLIDEMSYLFSKVLIFREGKVLADKETDALYREYGNHLTLREIFRTINQEHKGRI